MALNQAVKPGHINMGRVIRQLSAHTNQARKMVYHRPPIYGKDGYGVVSGGAAGISTPEMLIPDLPVLVRPLITKDYTLSKGGANVIGATRIYTPNIRTIKGIPNFNQEDNVNFDEIEGWDRFIDNDRTIYRIPTTATGSWTQGGSATLSSDGESLIMTMTSLYANAITFTPSSPVNTLEADRVRFQIKASGSVSLRYIASYNGGASADDYILWDASPDFVLLDNNWLTIDMPFESGTSAVGTSIFQTGTRHNVAVSSGSTFSYEGNLNKILFDVSGDTDDTVYIRNAEFYKSISWHVRSVREYNDGFIIFNCVRTKGKRDSLRRSYGTAY